MKKHLLIFTILLGLIACGKGPGNSNLDIDSLSSERVVQNCHLNLSERQLLIGSKKTASLKLVLDALQRSGSCLSYAPVKDWPKILDRDLNISCEHNTCEITSKTE